MSILKKRFGCKIQTTKCVTNSCSSSMKYMMEFNYRNALSVALTGIILAYSVSQNLRVYMTLNKKYLVWLTYVDLRNKTSSQCLHSLVKTEANVWENSRADQ